MKLDQNNKCSILKLSVINDSNEISKGFNNTGYEYHSIYTYKSYDDVNNNYIGLVNKGDSIKIIENYYILNGRKIYYNGIFTDNNNKKVLYKNNLEITKNGFIKHKVLKKLDI